MLILLDRSCRLCPFGNGRGKHHLVDQLSFFAQAECDIILCIALFRSAGTNGHLHRLDPRGDRSTALRCGKYHLCRREWRDCIIIP